jgi:GAF domain-containing protein
MGDEWLAMQNQTICKGCGQAVQPNEQRCPHCGTGLPNNPQIDSISPEMLVHRLGAYILESGVINADDLQKALDYQKSESSKRHIRLGQVLTELGLIDHDILDQAVTKQLISYKNALEESNRQLEQRVNERTSDLERRLAAMQALNTICQAVSVGTEVTVIYQLIHREVANIFGNVYFAIATYNNENDLINIPYLFDGHQNQQVDSFPLGDGLISILLRSQKPLLFVEDIERKIHEIGAKFDGPPAKSWLGVPVLVPEGIFGAVIVQDLEQEGRFNENDQQWLTALAAQVAIAIRNAHFLEGIYQHAEREHQLFKITSEIRNSPDIAGIFATTARELCKVLGARRALIELGSDFRLKSQENNNHGGQEKSKALDEVGDDEDYPITMNPGELPEE